MKTTNLLSRLMLVTAAALLASTANAAPAIDSVIVQGYMKQANDTAVPDGTYSLDVGVVQGANTIWAKHYTTVSVVNGLFSVTLSGNGDNIGTGTAFDPVLNSGNFST